MNAFLKDIKVPQHDKFMPVHQIVMMFATSMDSEELYSYATSVEAQFCDKDEIRMELPNLVVEEKLKQVNALIGKLFEINLYKITVKEMTDNRYVEFETYDGDDIAEFAEFRHASCMSKNDYLTLLKYQLCMQGIQGHLDGVLHDGTTEKITIDTFFPHTIVKKNFNIPYDKYPNINGSFIINEASIDEINNGFFLANEIKDGNILKIDFDKSLDQINEYRSKIRKARIANESIIKKILFWQPKEIVDELQLSQEFISLAIDSVILSRSFPSDCEKTKQNYFEESVNALRKTFKKEHVEEKKFRGEMQEFIMSLAKKYKGNSKLKPIN